MAPLAGKASGPLVDHHTTTALEAALQQLAFSRFIAPTATWDPSAQMPLLASLIELAQRWLHEEVHRARQAGASWAEIGRLLGVPAAAARAQHAPPQARNAAQASTSTQTTNPTEVTPLATH